jgi:hypothetical protein
MPMRNTARRFTKTWIQSRDNPIADTLVASAMDEQLFSVLVRECGDALKTYIAEAEKTCAMLNECKGKRLDTNDQRRIMAQRSTENEAATALRSHGAGSRVARRRR